MAEHYYTESPKAKYVEYLIKTTIANFNLLFKSASGVFSAREIDKASKLLAEKSKLPEEGKILDLGCGYGMIGIAAAKRSPKSKIILIDINKRATKLAIENVKMNRIKNAEVRQGNLYEPVADEKFDAILLNPPMAAGRKLCLQMIDQSIEHLNKGGSLQVVARHKKGGAVLFEDMKKIFSKTETLAKKGGFRVYKGTKS